MTPFLRHAPVVLDAGLLDAGPVPWDELARALRRLELAPIAAANAPQAEEPRVVAARLGLIQLGPRLRTVEPEAPPAPAPAPAPKVLPEPVAAPPPIVREPLVVTQPVRGGQVVYARGVDLVARAPVNAGAQVIADGSIQVWAPLRGRALAGAQGKKDARIMCLALEAELVSVNGEYLRADEIPDALRGKPAQVFFADGRVQIAGL
jgi:septum site-determining protein MinC